MNSLNCAKNDSVLIRGDRKVKQGFVDIKNISLQQLDELIKRQNKLLLNRYFLEKLPDKGKKILLFKATLEIEYKKRQDEYNTACQLLSNLSLKDKNAEELEWNDRTASICDKQVCNNNLGDEEIREEGNNVLKYIATHSGTASGKNYAMNFCEKEANEKSILEVKNVLYINKFCKKYDNFNKFQKRYQPNQLKDNDKTLFLTSAVKVKEKLGNKWEVTQATPPLPIFKNTVMIGLLESLKLQKEQTEKLRELEKKIATEKLLQNLSNKVRTELPIKDITKYRNIQSLLDDNTDDEENSLSDSDS